jgi:hypothetical protein
VHAGRRAGHQCSIFFFFFSFFSSLSHKTMPSAWEPLLLLALYVALDLWVALVVQRPAAAAAAHAARARRAAAAARLAAKAATSPETFAAAAKLERQALAYEREADRADSDAGAVATDPRLKGVATLKTVAGLALAARWWGGGGGGVGGGEGW